MASQGNQLPLAFFTQISYDVDSELFHDRGYTRSQRKESHMNELYEAIEAKIKAAGYKRPISGADVYDDICDQIDGKENGDYLLLSKFEEDVTFEYHITIRDEDFNLGVLTITAPEGTYTVDFDAD